MHVSRLARALFAATTSSPARRLFRAGPERREAGGLSASRASMVNLACLLLAGSLLLPPALWAQTPPPTPSLLVKLVPGLSPAEQLDILARNGGTLRSSIPALRLHVIDVAAELLGETLARYQADAQVERAEENKTRLSEGVPADPLFANQWALPLIGWDLAFGVINPTGTAKVALLDTGVDPTHPDLIGKVLPGTSILDGSNGLTDPSGHGTALAGIIAAGTGNSEGIAGVAYEGVQVMPVTVLNEYGEGQDSDVIHGVIWAVENGAHVILMAFSNPGFSPALQEALDYAWSQGVVLVAAAGNNGSTEPHFPGGDRGVMGVAATDETDAVPAFSNRGEGVFIAAPGVNIPTLQVGAYTIMGGTSAAAAHVAGAAALLKAVDPSLTNGVIVFRLASTADPAGSQDQTGNGRIHLARALASTDLTSIQPAGAAPLGGGGPFVGPYLAAARNFTINFAGSGGGSVTISVSTGDIGNPGGTCGTGAPGAFGTLSATITATCTSLQSQTNGATVTLTAAPNASSSFVNWSNESGDFNTCSASPTNPTCANVLGSGGHSITVNFATRIDTTTNAASASATYGAATVTLSATVTPASGPAVAEGTVTFTVKNGATTIGSVTSGTVISGNASASFPLGPTVNAGSYSIEATYNPAATNPQFNSSFDPTPGTLTINTANQTITVGTAAPPTATFNASFTVVATASSGLPVAIAGSGACSGSGSGSASITMTSGTGTCTVIYNQAGNGNYNAAPEVQNTTTAQKANQTISVTTPAPAAAIYDTTFGVTATAPGGAVAITTSGVCSGSGSGSANVTMTSGTGTCTVHYNQAGNGNYNAAPEALNTTTAQKANQTISVTTPAPAAAIYDTTFGVTATAPGGAVAITTSGVCSGSGSGSANVTMTSGTGTCTVHYNQAGNGNYNAAPEALNTTTAQKANQTISVTTPAPAAAIYDTTFGVTATAPGGAVAITTSGACSGSGSGSANVTMTSGTGTCTVHYNQAGNGNYNAAPEALNTTTAQKANQTISVTTPAPAAAIYDTTFGVTATAPGGAVAITTSGVCSGSGSGSANVTMTSGTGTCTVHYNQAGNGNYNAAPEALNTTTAQKANQTISVTTPAPAAAIYDTTFGVTATAPGGAVAITTSGVCSGSGSGSANVTMTSGTGTCTVHYNQAGNGNYNAAPEALNTTTAQKASQIITFNALPNKYFLDPTFAVSATASSGLTVSFSSTTPSVCTVAGDMVDLLLAGLCTIKASQGGDSNYAAAPDVPQSFTVTGYSFTGFFAPIDNLPILNKAKAGQSIPIKFSLNGYQGMNIFAAGSPGSISNSCGGASDEIEELDTPGSSGLTYEAGTDRYHYVWKTEKNWAGQCRTLVIKLADGTIHTANFNFTK